MTVGRLVLGALLASIALALAAAPARADDEIALSADGVTWGDELDAPLFERGPAWVPGDAAIRSFYLRNDGPSDARLRVSVRTRGGDKLVPDDHIVLSARAAGGAWSRLGNGQDVDPLALAGLGEGGTVRVDIRASFRWASTNATMLGELPLTIIVTLVQDGPVDGPDDGIDGLLPDAGSAVSWWLVAAAGACVVLGSLLVVAGRRRRSSDG